MRCKNKQLNYSSAYAQIDLLVTHSSPCMLPCRAVNIFRRAFLSPAPQWCSFVIGIGTVSLESCPHSKHRLLLIQSRSVIDLCFFKMLMTLIHREKIWGVHSLNIPQLQRQILSELIGILWALMYSAFWNHEATTLITIKQNASLTNVRKKRPDLASKPIRLTEYIGRHIHLISMIFPFL